MYLCRASEAIPRFCGQKQVKKGSLVVTRHLSAYGRWKLQGHVAWHIPFLVIFLRSCTSDDICGFARYLTSSRAHSQAVTMKDETIMREGFPGRLGVGTCRKMWEVSI